MKEKNRARIRISIIILKITLEKAKEFRMVYGNN
jgi:hypothetical protein